MGCFIVAEAGVNHLGNRAKMLALCDAAKAAGADAVKFQAYNTKALVERRKITIPKTIKLLDDCELSDADLDAIAENCAGIDLKWFASVFDPSQVERVLARGACALKIGHAEIHYDELIVACNSQGVPKYISAPKPPSYCWVQVHCIAEYPATSPPRLREAVCGFSSHYADWRIPAAAAMRDIEYLECHFKISDDCPESAWSLSKEDFAKMVRQVREYESWL